MEYSFATKNGDSYFLRTIKKADASALGNYFTSLSSKTKSRFGPHPLTREYVALLCESEEDTADRYLLIEQSTGDVHGYFILEYGMIGHEQERYLEKGLELEDGKDLFFAPSILDKVQNLGLASLVMPLLISEAKKNNFRSMVLLGGVRSTNERAIAFYEKFGFETCGGYESDVFNNDMRLLF